MDLCLFMPNRVYSIKNSIALPHIIITLFFPPQFIQYVQISSTYCIYDFWDNRIQKRAGHCVVVRTVKYCCYFQTVHLLQVFIFLFFFRNFRSSLVCMHTCILPRHWTIKRCGGACVYEKERNKEKIKNGANSIASSSFISLVLSSGCRSPPFFCWLGNWSRPLLLFPFVVLQECGIG